MPEILMEKCSWVMGFRSNPWEVIYCDNYTEHRKIVLGKDAERKHDHLCAEHEGQHREAEV